MTNNKGFLITIPTFSANNVEEAAKAVSRVMKILYENSANGYFEIPFSEGGIEVEVNTQEFYEISMADLN